MGDTPERTVPAGTFVQTLNANVDNERLSDAGFRQFVRNTLPAVIFRRVAARPSSTFVDQSAPRAGQPTDRAGLIRTIRSKSLDLHRSRYMLILEDFSLESFSVARLSDMPESRLRELLEAVERG